MTLLLHYNKMYLFFILNILCGCLTMFAMELVVESSDLVHIPHYFRPIKRWKIDEIKSVHIQGGIVIPNNKGQTITRDELYLLDEALEADKRNKFELFYLQLAQNDNVNLSNKTTDFGQGQLRLLINAVGKAEVTRLQRLLVRCCLPSDVQQRFVPLMQNIIVNGLKDVIIKKNISQNGICLDRHTKMVNGGETVNAVAFSPDSTYMVSAPNGLVPDLMTWNCNKKASLATWNSHSKDIAAIKDITAIAIRPDNNMIAIGGSEKYIQVSNLCGVPQEPIYTNTPSTSLLKFSHDGTMLVSGHRGELIHSKLKLWNSMGKTLRQNFDAYADVFFVGFSPDDTKIVSVDSNHYKNIHVWDIATGDKLWSVRSKCWGFDIVEGNMANRWLIAECDIDSKTNELRFLWYDLEAKKELGYAVFNDHVGPYIFAKICSDDDDNDITIKSVDKLNYVKVWSGLTGQELAILKEHNVQSIAYSHNGNRLALGLKGEQNNPFLWDIVTEKEEKALNALKAMKDIDLVGLVYDLYLGLFHSKVMRLRENSLSSTIFAKLPKVVQEVLCSVFSKKIFRRA